MADHAKTERTSVSEQLSGRAGVVWITGFSGAGKTTVGRLVERQLRAMGAPTVLLDGDDLRSIFGEHWGYDRESRIELARVYFRLCSHLASQGLTVIISAVALYNEVSAWVKANIPGAMQVYLSVPEEERRKRDSATKRLYEMIGDVSQLYDPPKDAELTVRNYERRPEEAAEEVVRFCWPRLGSDRADHGRIHHWANYYSKMNVPLKPSPFARAVSEELPKSSTILEVGCGNGRDASHFARCSHDVVALDVSRTAIDLCRRTHNDLPIRFFCTPISSLDDEFMGSFDIIYSRFCLHAMTESEEIEVLQSSFSFLKPGGRLFVECRSIDDPLARMGEVISPTERIFGHYRRFIIPEELASRLENAGFDLVSLVQARGLAIHGDEDPVVIRVTARRNQE